MPNRLAHLFGFVSAGEVTRLPPILPLARESPQQPGGRRGPIFIPRSLIVFRQIPSMRKHQRTR